MDDLLLLGWNPFNWVVPLSGRRNVAVRVQRVTFPRDPQTVGTPSESHSRDSSVWAVRQHRLDRERTRRREYWRP